jgi:hypothetical protein
MSVFRLVLCLAGLAVYLLAKQTLPLTEASDSVPLQTPDSGEVIASPLNADEASGAALSPEPASSSHAGKHIGTPLLQPGVVGFKKPAK